jgi:hypothetical protein
MNTIALILGNAVLERMMQGSSDLKNAIAPDNSYNIQIDGGLQGGFIRIRVPAFVAFEVDNMMNRAPLIISLAVGLPTDGPMFLQNLKGRVNISPTREDGVFSYFISLN